MKKLKKCSLIALLMISQVAWAQSTFVRKGKLDLRGHTFASKGPVALNGDWEFYISQLVPPSAFTAGDTIAKEYIEFPSTWNNISKSRSPGFGFATYHLKLFVDHEQKIAIELPHFYTAYECFVNGLSVARNGTVGKTAEESKPTWQPMTLNIDLPTDSVDVVIHASNFHHTYGGVREPIVIGDRDQMQFKRSVAINSNMAMTASLLVISLTFLVIFFIAKRQSSVVFFAGLAMVWCVRSIFSNQYLATLYLPEIPWEIVVKIEYITLYVMMIMAMLFLGSLFKQDVNHTFKYLFCFCNVVFTGLTIFLPASVYTQFLPVYLSFSAALLLYATYVLVRAIVYEREGVWFMVSCVFLAVMIFSFDIIAYEGFATYDPIIVNGGYIMMFLLMAAALILQTGLIKKSSSNSNILTFDELYRNDNMRR